VFSRTKHITLLVSALLGFFYLFDSLGGNYEIEKKLSQCEEKIEKEVSEREKDFDDDNFFNFASHFTINIHNSYITPSTLTHSFSKPKLHTKRYILYHQFKTHLV